MLMDAYKEHTCKKRSEASLSDDAHALSALYERFRRPIRSYIYRLLGSQEDADDVTQEVFVRVFTAWDGLHDRDNLSAWLYRIATNLSVDLLRRRKRISWWALIPPTRGEEGYFLLTNDGGIAEVGEREHIRLALANMPEGNALALVLDCACGVNPKIQ